MEAPQRRGLRLNLQDLLKWINQPAASDPATVIAAGFQASRLAVSGAELRQHIQACTSCFRSRGEGFLRKARLIDIDRNEEKIDIHHIFPRKWCEEQLPPIPPRVYDSIVNKTAISYKANRKIGGKAPSDYLKQIETDKAVQFSQQRWTRSCKHTASPPHF